MTKTEHLAKRLSMRRAGKPERQHATPYELIEDLLGRAGSGRGDLSVSGRTYVLDIVLDMLRARRARMEAHGE